MRTNLPSPPDDPATLWPVSRGLFIGAAQMQLPAQIVRLVDEINAIELELVRLGEKPAGRDLSRESERLAVVTMALIRERERMANHRRRALRNKPAGGRSSRAGAA